jgi:hypothetical protein
MRLKLIRKAGFLPQEENRSCLYGIPFTCDVTGVKVSTSLLAGTRISYPMRWDARSDQFLLVRPSFFRSLTGRTPVTQVKLVNEDKPWEVVHLTPLKLDACQV